MAQICCQHKPFIFTNMQLEHYVHSFMTFGADCVSVLRKVSIAVLSTHNQVHPTAYVCVLIQYIQYRTHSNAAYTCVSASWALSAKRSRMRRRRRHTYSAGPALCVRFSACTFATARTTANTHALATRASIHYVHTCVRACARAPHMFLRSCVRAPSVSM